MDIKFEKSGMLFSVTLEDREAFIEVNGVKALCSPQKHHEQGWLFSIRDKNFAQAVGSSGEKIAILHESAEKVLAAMEQAKKNYQAEQDEIRRKSEEGRKHLSLVYYFDDYTLEVIIAQVVKMNEEEEEKYREEYRGRIHYLSIDSGRKEVDIMLNSVQKIMKRPADGYAVQGGTVWYITKDERKEIFAEAKEIREEKERRATALKAEEEADRQAKFDEAKRNGKPVLLRQWTVECDDPQEECNTDTITEYALPSGGTKRVRTHTW